LYLAVLLKILSLLMSLASESKNSPLSTNHFVEQ
jgi:hypothetical protein